MKQITFLSTAVAVLLLAGSPAAKAVNLQLSAVTPLDTFSFDIVGFNTGSGTGSYVVSPATATFGVTSTTLGVDGQTVTITSSESIGLTTTTDTFTLSTPTNFITDSALAGVVINGLQFDLGDANSGSNPVNLALPFSSYTAVGTAIDGVNTSVPLQIVNTFPGAGNTSYSAAEGVNTGVATTAINTYTVHSFTYSITYNTLPIPEPSTWAILGLGTVAGVAAIRRRRLAA